MRWPSVSRTRSRASRTSPSCSSPTCPRRTTRYTTTCRTVRMFLSTLLSLRCFVKLICAHSIAAVISHLSAGKHAMDEEGFQRTMRYIFTFIEKVTILSPLPSQQLTAGLAHRNKPNRKSKRRVSSRSSVSASGSARTRANGATLRSVCRFCRSSPSVR